MKTLTIALLVVISVIFLLPSTVVAQDPFKDICSGKGADSSVCRSKGFKSNPFLGKNGVITRVIQFLVMIAGVASVIMIMVGGFKYITSTGDSAKVNSAKDTILYAIIGLAVAILAQSIVSFVLMRL